tara:strand:+ start:621 stop:1562 length:942 start_codon:yes stop_codon:yes gene_type:complete
MSNDSDVIDNSENNENENIENLCAPLETNEEQVLIETGNKNVDEVVNTIITNVENSGNNNENNNESGDIENDIQALHNNEHRVIVDLAKLNNPEEIDKIYESLEKYCNLKRQTHWMCARHYACMDKYFSVPSIVLSSLSGIGSFLASIAYFEEYSTVFTVSVGVMASVTTLFQSFSNAFEYSTRAEAHQNATEAFDQIITKLKFERLNPVKDAEPGEFIDGIEKQIVETKQRCKYIVPDWIEGQYSDTKFKNLKNNKTKDIYKAMINLKSEKYLEIMRNKKFNELNLDHIDEELGFKKLNEKEFCEDNTCCCV